MSQVIALSFSTPAERRWQALGGLLQSFATDRRIPDDVFWLKENAELLNILECTDTRPPVEILDVHSGFYDGIEDRITFFPQYYRFLLSICLDLEDLGIGGTKGEALVAWAAQEGLAQAELSDLQRAEARRLLLRRGIDPMARDQGLDDRLRAFIGRGDTFALPNKKAAYELTHILFYLSEYGRRDPQVPPEAVQSLQFAGTLAFLEGNADLLAEICIALRFADVTPPAAWETWLTRHANAFTIRQDAQLGLHDDYHEYFVCNWFLAVSGGQAFVRQAKPGRLIFGRPWARTNALREMSGALYDLAGERRRTWQSMKPRITDQLSDEASALLILAEEAAPEFETFFRAFSRAQRVC